MAIKSHSWGFHLEKRTEVKRGTCYGFLHTKAHESKINLTFLNTILWVSDYHNLPMRFSKIESDKLSTDMSLTKWKQTNSAIFSALFFISKVRFKPCWVMQATIIICRRKNSGNIYLELFLFHLHIQMSKKLFLK